MNTATETTPVVEITTTELVAKLNAKRGAYFVTIEATTEAKIAKKNNPWGAPVLKTSRVNGMLNWHYENAVNSQRTREASEGETPERFESAGRAWGTRLRHDNGALTAFVEHKGQLYLELKVQKSLGHVYTVNGTAKPADEVEALLPKKVEGARQEVERPVILRDYSLANVNSIVLDGIEYRITPNA